MKRFYLFLIGFSLTAVSLLMAEPSGLTTNIPEFRWQNAGPAARPLAKDMISTKSSTQSHRLMEDWYVADSLEMDRYLTADGYMAVHFSHETESIALIDGLPALTEAAQAAVEKAPDWMAADLENTFFHMDETAQNTWAACINDAADPYVDEIAFSIAHTSPELLSSSFGNPELYTYNAELMYSMDTELSYVQIVDYGSSSDADYYSTTKYLKADTSGTETEVEVPRDIYYWYVVLPKITDEIPGFVVPATLESNETHQNNFGTQPDGKFWRNYLYNHADEGYPLLRDMLMNCSIVWNGASYDTTSAIGAIHQWISESMVFDSDFERPHQPVRIYAKHKGRCGEHADMRVACARLALIPATSIFSISGDHTWNEFWDERWVHWDGPELDNPLVYENGWGKVFGSVFEIRSDGCLFPVTERYSEETATITIFAEDGAGNPLDGAEILLAVHQIDGGSIYVDSWGATDSEGKAVFVVGENRKYYARMSSSIGSDPPSGSVSLVVENAAADGEYSALFSASGVISITDILSTTIPEDDIDDYRLEIEYLVANEMVTRTIPMDDYEPTTFYSPETGGQINCFSCDASNFSMFASGVMCFGFHTYIDSCQATSLFDLPINQDWYTVLVNDLNLRNAQRVQAKVRLWHYGELPAENVHAPLQASTFMNNYPNPFNPETTIQFALQQGGNVDLTIYNVKGQRVKTLLSKHCEAGNHSIIWNGQNESGENVASGLYFYRLTTVGKTITKKMMLMK